jgi:carbonic anhydrase/acetyltransferase-like protein (isoleucine patch superfamily)
MSFIASTAAVMGKVTLGKQVSIWYGAVLRGDTESITIGDGCNIQDNAVVHADPGHPTILAENVTVGHSAIVHGAQIGEGSMIGMHSTLLNGCKIGKYCLIAAGALVKEGMEIPDYSMVVGMPGKIIRTLSEEDVEWLKKSAPHYIAMSERHKAGEFPIITQKDIETC